MEARTVRRGGWSVGRAAGDLRQPGEYGHLRGNFYFKKHTIYLHFSKKCINFMLNIVSFVLQSTPYVFSNPLQTYATLPVA